MGSLTKLAEVAQEEIRYTPAEMIKIAAANLTNFIAATVANGGQIKEASTKQEINHELIVKVAKLYVKEHYDLYKQAVREQAVEKLMSVFNEKK